MKTKIRKWACKASGILKKHPGILFVLAVLIMAWAYEYHQVAGYPPQSIHRWRQTDCTSIALNFYQHGMHFFKPEVHSLVSDSNTTGYAAGEAPLLYYSVALIYKLLGADDNLYRIFNTLIFLTGLWALFRISRNILKDKYMAAFVALLIFTSPVAVYYGCNYLPDTTALSLSFLGWWLFIRHRDSGRYGPFLLAVLFFGVGGLLKVTMSISLVALAALAVMHHLKWPLKEGAGLRVKPLLALLPILTAVALIAGWYLYAIRFNRIHESGTFLTSTRPWWAMTREERKALTGFILDNNITLYFSWSIYAFLAACLVMAVTSARRMPQWLMVLTALLLTGGILYVNLWYSQFQYHDYYFILLFVPVAFLVITALYGLRHRMPSVSASWPFRLALLALLTANVFHARHEMQLRYHGWKREAPVYEAYFTIRPYLQSLGIRPEDRVISIPDGTSCYTLYMMNRQGNNLPGINPSTAGQIRKYIRLGARYLFVNDSTLLNDPMLEGFLGEKAGETGQVSIYKLDRKLLLTPFESETDHQFRSSPANPESGPQDLPLSKDPGSEPQGLPLSKDPGSEPQGLPLSKDPGSGPQVPSVPRQPET